MADSSAHKYIKSILKYTASKRYVGNFSGALVNDCWLRINETEYNGFAYNISVGYICKSMIQNAFMREMSYNPMRYKINWSISRQIKSPEDEIISHINKILRRFSVLWPNGIHGCIKIKDICCDEYLFLRDMRNCFKAIASQNMADFNKKEYRDEIVAAIAGNQTLYIGADMRRHLMQMAAATADVRARRRHNMQLNYRINSLERELQINIRHDSNYAAEMTRELEALKSEYDILNAGTSKHKNKPAVQKPVQISRTTTFVSDDEECDKNDAYDREQELMNTWTKAHSLGATPDLFKEYIAQHTGHSR